MSIVVFTISIKWEGTIYWSLQFHIREMNFLCPLSHQIGASICMVVENPWIYCICKWSAIPYIFTNAAIIRIIFQWIWLSDLIFQSAHFTIFLVTNIFFFQIFEKLWTENTTTTLRCISQSHLSSTPTYTFTVGGKLFKI